MAEQLNMQTVNRSDSDELRITKLNRNFQAISRYLFSMDRTTGKTSRTVKGIDKGIDVMSGQLGVVLEEIEDLEGRVNALKAIIDSMEDELIIRDGHFILVKEIPAETEE